MVVVMSKVDGLAASAFLSTRQTRQSASVASHHHPTLSPTMPVRLRLSMHGPKHSKIFHLVAVDQRKRRDAKPIELLGVYNPRVLVESGEKKMEWAVQRIKYWLDQGGAQPSKPVLRLLERVRFLMYAWSAYH